MENEESQDQPLDRMVEPPDLDALRESYQAPSRMKLRVERIVRDLGNRTLWTVVLALGIIATLIIGYLQLT